MRIVGWLGVLGVGVVVACGGDKTQVAPTASGSALAAASAKTEAAKPFAVDTGPSLVGFSMEAPDEKIRGKAVQSVSGTLFIDPKDLSQTTGNIVVDLDKLELYQRKKGEDGRFPDEVRVPKQNEHARNWLEIDDTAPEPDRTKNRRVEFKIESISDLAEKDITKLQGAERTVSFTATGEFLLHQHKATKTVGLSATFTVEGDRVVDVRVKTTAPFAVSLAEFDVRPRKGFGVLAQSTLETFGSKVAKEAMIELDLRVMPEGGKAGAVLQPDPVPVASASAPTSGAVSASAAGPAK